MARIQVPRILRRTRNRGGSSDLDTMLRIWHGISRYTDFWFYSRFYVDPGGQAPLRMHTRLYRHLLSFWGLGSIAAMVLVQAAGLAYALLRSGGFEQLTNSRFIFRLILMLVNFTILSQHYTFVVHAELVVTS